MTGVNVVLTIAGFTILVLGVFAGAIRNRFWISEPVICVGLGIIVGPAALEWIPGELVGPSNHELLREVARLTLGMAVMGAALRLPPRFAFVHFRGLATSLGVGMPLMWLSAALVCAVIGSMELLPAIAVGAALSSTDPVLAASIVRGRLSERYLPADLRNLVTAESGANDGLALMFVMLPILLATRPPDAALGEWLVRTLGWEILGSVVIGMAIGWIAGVVLRWARHQNFAEHTSLLTLGLALVLAVLGAVRLIGSDGILAVFAAGLAFNRVLHDVETRHGEVQEAISRFFDLPFFILLGASLPWAAWNGLGWPFVAVAVLILVVRRLPWWLLLRPSIPELKSSAEAAMAGWFGPMGAASIYYAVVIEDRTGFGSIFAVTSLVVTVSIVAHGLSAMPLQLVFDRVTRRGDTTGKPASTGTTAQEQR